MQIKINLNQKLVSFSEHWSPEIIVELYGQHVKVANQIKKDRQQV